jgi:hypothetical protein
MSGEELHEFGMSSRNSRLISPCMLAVSHVTMMQQLAEPGAAVRGARTRDDAQKELALRSLGPQE